MAKIIAAIIGITICTIATAETVASCQRAKASESGKFYEYCSANFKDGTPEAFECYRTARKLVEDRYKECLSKARR